MDGLRPYGRAVSMRTLYCVRVDTRWNLTLSWMRLVCTDGYSHLRPRYPSAWTGTCVRPDIANLLAP